MAPSRTVGPSTRKPRAPRTNIRSFSASAEMTVALWTFVASLREAFHSGQPGNQEFPAVPSVGQGREPSVHGMLPAAADWRAVPGSGLSQRVSRGSVHTRRVYCGHSDSRGADNYGAAMRTRPDVVAPMRP